jgi:transcriptional regulator with XRE-family HTH domain
MTDHLDPDLRDFLRACRARITPEEAGLAGAPARRRGPGLRRSEVAQLAGISSGLYERLESGRARTVPEAVLDSLARALQLAEPDRDALFALVRPAVSRRRPMRPQQLRPLLGRVLESLTDVPGLVLGHRLDVLAAGPAARLFYPALHHNLLRYLFTVPAARELHRDWRAAARSAVAALHDYAGHHPYDPELADLVGELSVADADFRRWWAESPAAYRPLVLRFRHPLVGEVTLAEELWHVGGESGQVLHMLVAEPGSPAEASLRLMGSLTAP